ncbi:hypothetical protein A2U01_0030592, partial [Trifolium medium]|nr:hypothetical protein [Trifolium medium]
QTNSLSPKNPAPQKACTVSSPFNITTAEHVNTIEELIQTQSNPKSKDTPEFEPIAQQFIAGSEPTPDPSLLEKQPGSDKSSHLSENFDETNLGESSQDQPETLPSVTIHSEYPNLNRRVIETDIQNEGSQSFPIKDETSTQPMVETTCFSTEPDNLEHLQQIENLPRIQEREPTIINPTSSQASLYLEPYNFVSKP